MLPSQGRLAREARVEEGVLSAVRSRPLVVARGGVAILTRRLRSGGLLAEVPRLVRVLRLGRRRALRPQLPSVQGPHASGVLARRRARVEHDREAKLVLKDGVGRQGEDANQGRRPTLPVHPLPHGRGLVHLQLDGLVGPSSVRVRVRLLRRDHGHGPVGDRVGALLFGWCSRRSGSRSPV